MAEGGALEKKAVAIRRTAMFLSIIGMFYITATLSAFAFSMPDVQPVSSLLKPVAVFGDDNREPVPEKWSALEGRIGMLYEQSTQTLCTAFCVGKGVVATASHCLFQPKRNQLPNLGEVTFRLNYGKVLRQSKIAGNNTAFAKNNIAVGTTAYQNEPPLSAPKDWALVRLETPICQFGILEVQPKKVQELIEKSRQDKIFQIAYHWDYKHWELAYSKPCSVARDFDQIKWRSIRQHFINADDLVLHTCDTGGASSGSPILLDTSEPQKPDNPPVVVGINVGTYTRTRLLVRQGRIIKRLKPDIIANTAVNAPAFGPVIDVLEHADLLASQEEMLKLQEELQTRGLYAGVLDGSLGRSLRAAIINYERSNNLPVTGIPSKKLLSRLGEDRVKPSHVLTTGTGSIDDFSNQPVTPAPVVPRRLKKIKKPWDPFDPYQ
jgi:hypothetical protein